MRPAAGFVLVSLLWCSVPASPGQGEFAAIRFGSGPALMDEIVPIRLTAFPPRETVVVRAQTEWQGKVWQSHATFVTDEQGSVDLARQAPTTGSYTGVDPMGLIWSMTPTDAPPRGGPALKITDPRTVRLTAEVDGKEAAVAELQRWLAKPGVRITDVRENGLVGRLYEPAEPGRRPAVLVLSGSEGGTDDAEAALLASRGYTAFALAYFGAEELPKALVKIPLEYLKQGMDWLRARESVDGSRLAVVGASKGGELALLLGATFPEITAVVATVPSHVVWSGIGGNYRDSSWTYKNEPLPCATTRRTPALTAQFASGKPVRLIGMYQAGLEDDAAAARAVIPVEKIRGAVLLISGGDDQMWPSALMADKVIERLKAHRHPHPYQHLRYDQAGHAIPSAFVPLQDSVAAGRFYLGGTVQANAQALADSRPKVLRFLKDNLDGRAP